MLHLWKWWDRNDPCGSFLPCCPWVIPQVSSSPSLPWGHLRHPCGPEPSLPKADQAWLFPLGNSYSPPQKWGDPSPSFPLFTSQVYGIIFLHAGRVNRVQESTLQTHSVNWEKVFFPPYQGASCNSPVQKIPISWLLRLIKCGENGNSLNYVAEKLGHGQNTLWRKFQFHRNAGMQEQDPDYGLKRSSRKYSQLFPPLPKHQAANKMF